MLIDITVMVLMYILGDDNKLMNN